MNRKNYQSLAGGTLMAACAFWIAGCTPAPPANPQAGKGGATGEKHADHEGHVDGDEHAGHDHAHGHDHSAWWCAEHGMPEEVCAQCNSKLAAAFQKKGDWCEDHDRPDSQCFVCHPELIARFAAQYEAKYGKQPPELKLD